MRPNCSNHYLSNTCGKMHQQYQICHQKLLNMPLWTTELMWTLLCICNTWAEETKSGKNGKKKQHVLPMFFSSQYIPLSNPHTGLHARAHKRTLSGHVLMRHKS